MASLLLGLIALLLILLIRELRKINNHLYSIGPELLRHGVYLKRIEIHSCLTRSYLDRIRVRVKAPEIEEEDHAELLTQAHGRGFNAEGSI